MRLPSGATAAPWFTSIPSITPTTLFVAGSMTWTVSPALLVWVIRTTLFVSAVRETAQKTSPVETARYPRNNCLFLIVVNSSLHQTHPLIIITALHRLSHDPG